MKLPSCSALELQAAKADRPSLPTGTTRLCRTCGHLAMLEGEAAYSLSSDTNICPGGAKTVKVIANELHPLSKI